MNYLDIRLISFLFLPLISFIILIFFGSKIKNKSHYIALPLIGLMLANSVSFLIKSLSEYHLELTKTFEWFSTGMFSISLGYFIDNVTCDCSSKIAIVFEM